MIDPEQHSSGEQLHSPQEIYAELEAPNWAPWLRFDIDTLTRHQAVFPGGQFVLEGEDDSPIASLSTNRISWDGSPEDLSTWDDVAGADCSYEDTFDPEGNTLVFMSMSVHKDHKGEHLPDRLIQRTRLYAAEQGIERIIGDFRPSGFGQYKKETHDFDFEHYVTATRADGKLKDPWLRAMTYRGWEALKVDPRSMVVEATEDEFEAFRTGHNPDSWWQVQDDATKEQLTAWHQPAQELEQVDEVWECEETGTWYVDRQAQKAVYIESNVWGEVKPQVFYNLNETARDELESNLVSLVEKSNPEAPMTAVWIAPDHPYADLVRTLETGPFPTITDFVSPQVEERSRFLAIVDTREQQKRVVHAARVSGVNLGNPSEAAHVNRDGTLGLVMLDEIIQSPQHVSGEDIIDYYARQGIDIARCIGVDTNFRVGEKVDTGIDGIRVSDYSYIAFFKLVQSLGANIGESGVFAHINDGTIKSLNDINVEWEPLLGRSNIYSPSGNPAKPKDPDFIPTYLPISPHNAEVFRGIINFGLPEMIVR